MKVQELWLIASVVCGLTQGDKDVSSYAVLPYENEIQQHQPPHGLPADAFHGPNYFEPTVYYQYAHNNNKGKQKYTLDRIVKAPFKALKGAGDYMMGMFDDVRSKFLEFNGSLFRGKSSFFKSSGENLLRHSQNLKNKGNNYQDIVYYAPYQHVNPPTFNQNPKPIIPYGLKDDVDNFLGHEGAQHNEVHNSIDTRFPSAHATFNQIPIVHALQHESTGKEIEQKDASDDHTQVVILDRPLEPKNKVFGHNVQREVKKDSSSAFEGFKDLSAKKDLHREFPPDIGINDDFSIGRRSLKDFGPHVRKSSNAQVPTTKYIQQRSAKQIQPQPHPNSQRTQRSFYGGDGGGVSNFLRPIPVPVPFSVYPSRLVFPSIHDMQPVGGYQ